MKKIFNSHVISFHPNSESAFFGVQLIAIIVAFPVLCYMELMHQQASTFNPAEVIKKEQSTRGQNETALSFYELTNTVNF